MINMFRTITAIFITIIIVLGPGAMVIHYVNQSVSDGASQTGVSADVDPILDMIERVFIICSAIAILGLVLMLFVYALVKPKQQEMEWRG